MKKLFFLLLISYQVAAQTPKKISEYTPVSSLAGTEETIVNQGGVTRKATVDQIRTGLVPLSFKTGLDALNGLIKSNGSGGYTAITDNSSNWNTAFGWGNHAGLYRPISYVPAWTTITGRPNFDSLYWKTAGISELVGNTEINGGGYDLKLGTSASNLDSVSSNANLFDFRTQGTDHARSRIIGSNVGDIQFFNEINEGSTQTWDIMSRMYKSFYNYSGASEYTESKGLNFPGGGSVLSREYFISFFASQSAERVFDNSFASESFSLPSSSQSGTFYRGRTFMDYSIGNASSVGGLKITKDSVTVEMDGSTFFKIDDSGLSIWEPSTASTGHEILLRTNGSGRRVVTKLGIGSGLSISGGNLVASGTGATNLAFTPSSTNGIVTSDTGTDATIPLGNGTNSGLSLNDYTTAEKSKLAAITGTNTGDVSLAGTPDYITISGQTITRGLIDLATDVTGTLPSGNGGNATHTGDVTGATALTIANDAVTNAKAANMAVNTIKGRITSGTGDPEDLTAAQVRTITETETTTQLNTRDTNNRIRTNHTGTLTSNDASNVISDPIRVVTGAGSIVQADNGRTIYFNSATPFNFTIDQLSVNDQTRFINKGAGAVTFVVGTVTTIQGSTILPGASGGSFPYGFITYQDVDDPIIIVSGGGGGDMLAATYDPANIAQQVVGTTATQTLTNKSISTGSTWTGNQIGPTYGGTGQVSYTSGDILYAAGAGSLLKLPIGTAGQVLTVNVAGNLPEWQAPSGGGGGLTFSQTKAIAYKIR